MHLPKFLPDREIQHPAQLLAVGPYRSRIVPDFQPGPELTAARDSAFGRLRAKVGRLAPAGQLTDRTVPEAAIQFQALCEGLGNQELRGADLRLLPEGDEEHTWRSAFTTLVRGFGAPTSA